MRDLHEQKIKQALLFLILISTVIRLFIAGTLEFSVDEVYYWTYALYPDWSHFDHPPMVGWVIQLFTLNLFFDSELAIRLGAIVFSILNTLIIFSIGKNIKNSLTGLYAAFLLNSSIYCSVLAGNFIIPDTPQLLFWLLSLRYLIITLPEKRLTKKTSKNFLLASLFIGLAIISKYHGVFIWAGAGLYVLFFNRIWLKTPVFYFGFILSSLFTAPILIWNIQNDWISFTFHGDRVANQLDIRLDYFFTEIFGQIAYNNPVNYILIILALREIIKKRLKLDKDMIWVLLLNSLPIWLVFTSFSIFRQTLPHWTGPAFTPLILLASVYLAEKSIKKGFADAKLIIPGSIQSAVVVLLVPLIFAWALINYYPGTIGKTSEVSKYGDTDFTLDMYGWRQIRDGFSQIVIKDVSDGLISNNTPIITPKYFPGTEIDYYIARPLGLKLLQYGKLSDIHKYAWINESRGQLKEGDNAYMISTSNWYKDPYEYYDENFEEIVPTDTINVTRSGRLAYYAFIYQLKNYKGNFTDPFNPNKSLD
jgi:hypothetical protein